MAVEMTEGHLDLKWNAGFLVEREEELIRMDGSIV